MLNHGTVVSIRSPWTWENCLHLGKIFGSISPLFLSLYSIFCWLKPQQWHGEQWWLTFSLSGKNMNEHELWSPHIVTSLEWCLGFGQSSANGRMVTYGNNIFVPLQWNLMIQQGISSSWTRFVLSNSACSRMFTTWKNGETMQNNGFGKCKSERGTNDNCRKNGKAKCKLKRGKNWKWRKRERAHATWKGHILEMKNTWQEPMKIGSTRHDMCRM